VANIQVVRREVVKVNFGFVNDGSQRIVNVVGSIPNAYDPELDPSRFEPAVSDPEQYHSRAGIVAWLEGVVEKEVAIIKPDRYLSDFIALEGFVDGLEEFDHLDFPFLTCVPSWADELYRNYGIWWVPVTSRNSLRRNSGGNLHVPCFRCSPSYRKLSSDWVECHWGERTGVLVGCK